MVKYGIPIQVRLPEDIYDALRRKSDEEGIPMSMFIRRAVLRDFSVPDDTMNLGENTTNAAIGEHPTNGAPS